MKSIERKPRSTSIIDTTSRSTVFNSTSSNTNIKTNTPTNVKSHNAATDIITTTTNHSSVKDKADNYANSPSWRLESEEKEKRRSLSVNNTTNTRNGNNVSSITPEKDNNISLPELTQRRFTRGHLVPFLLPEDQGTAFIKSRPGPKPSFTDERQARALRNVRINYKHLAVPEHVELMLA